MLSLNGSGEDSLPHFFSQLEKRPADANALTRVWQESPQGLSGAAGPERRPEMLNLGGEGEEQEIGTHVVIQAESTA